MKGGLVVMLTALKAMKAAGTLDNAEITIVLSGDEERHGEPVSVSREDMIAAAKKSDVALEFENSSRIDGKDMVRIARQKCEYMGAGDVGQERALVADLQRVDGLWGGL